VTQNVTDSYLVAVTRRWQHADRCHFYLHRRRTCPADAVSRWRHHSPLSTSHTPITSWSHLRLLTLKRLNP